MWSLSFFAFPLAPASISRATNSPLQDKTLLTSQGGATCRTQVVRRRNRGRSLATGRSVARCTDPDSTDTINSMCKVQVQLLNLASQADAQSRWQPPCRRPAVGRHGMAAAGKCAPEIYLEFCGVHARLAPAVSGGVVQRRVALAVCRADVSAAL